MNGLSRRASLGLLLLSLAGCSSGGGGDGRGGGEERGQLNLPLATQGNSGATYRLRNARFRIQSYSYYEEDGIGGESDGPQVQTVSSEDDPTSDSISVSLERGDYSVTLQPNWHLEKVTAEGVTTVEATLLSSATTWVYIYPHTTRWAEYQFGVGERSLWLNGQLNIDIDVLENPDELYGSGARGGGGGSAGASSGGTGAGGSPAQGGESAD